ncbi:MAG TPA: hypothetical protein VGM06_07870 [Polyangiaceae bacterium]
MSRVSHVRAAGWAVSLAVASAATTARADNKNPNLIPLGETESFLGNAGVGRANDTGAVYYNPAGLVELGEGRISISGSVYLSVSTHYDSFVRFDNTDIPFDNSGFFTIPSAYVATRRVAGWTGALSVLVPASFQQNNRLPFATPSTKDNLIQSTSQSELWVGLSAAHKLGDKFAIGLTAFGILHEETATFGLDFQNPTTMAFASDVGQTDSTVFGFVATLGLAYLPTDWLRFGLRAQSAMLQVYGKESAYQETHTVAASGAPQSSGDDESGSANYAMPFDFTLGAAVTPAPWFAVLGDVSLQMGTSYATFPSSATFNEEVTLRPTPRFNLGVEMRPATAFPVRLGMYYNPSAEGRSPGAANYSKQDYYGLTAGVGLDTLLKEFKVRTTVGVFYAWSTGQATPIGVAGTTAAISSTAIGVLLTTGYAF